MKCIECGKEIGVMDDNCPFCGAEQYDDKPNGARTILPLKAKRNKGIIPVFSDAEQLIYGIHPNDKTYRDVLQLNVLSKNYKK